jgi:hypothetical protein
MSWLADELEKKEKTATSWALLKDFYYIMAWELS